MAPTYKMLSEDWRGLKAMLAPVTAHKLEDEHRLELITGGVIDMWSMDQPDAARGRRYKRVAINEAAQIPDLQDAWERAIRPTLTDYSGDAWFSSTPRGHNFYWTLWQRGQDRQAFPEWISWRYPTSANPFISRVEIDAAKEELPERVFAQEYLADFIENEGAVFRNIAACMHAQPTEPSVHKDHSVVIGADWGKQDDFTALSVLCLTCKQEVAHDRFTIIDYAFQRQRLVVIATRWGAEIVVAERNAMGDPIIEELGRDPALDNCKIVPFVTLPSTKPQLIENLSLAFERTTVQWIADPVWTSELEAYERKMSPITGRSTYSAPAGMHDDTVIARALAWSQEGKWLIA